MFSRIYTWIKTLSGRIITFVFVAVAFMTFLDYLLKWHIYSYLFNFVEAYLIPIFFNNTAIPIYLLFIAAILLLMLLIYFIRNKFKKEKYFIQIKGKFYNGFEPREYSRKTKWNYKDNTEYYFIPLLSHGYSGVGRDDVEFTDLCGPYCGKCDHLLHLNGSDDLGNKFVCVNCVKKYKIPKELLGDYQNKIMTYFREEFRQGKLKEVN